MVATLLGVVVSLVTFGLYVLSVLWVFADAHSREKSGCLVALIVAIPMFWPWSLLVWLIFRPRQEHAY
ncbi:hypothetical protein JW916_12330 [Candidatus Sumerlaeota bacterium]|nr:hypothetical protein [Candidatus Sumerlaeota bacterium]